MVMTARDEEEACELAQKEEYFSRKMSFFCVASSPWGDLLRVKEWVKIWWVVKVHKVVFDKWDWKLKQFG